MFKKTKVRSILELLGKDLSGRKVSKVLAKLIFYSRGQKVVRLYDPDGNPIEVGTPIASRKNTKIVVH